MTRSPISAKCEMSALNNSEVCVDSSVVVKLVLEEDDSDEVVEIWTGWAASEVRIVAPSLVWYEVISTVRKHHQRGELSDERARLALNLILDLPLTDVAGEALHRAAYEFAARLGHLVTYDAHYLAAAALSQCPLWTADRRMYDSAEKLGINATLTSLASRP